MYYYHATPLAALHIASKKGFDDVVRLLIEHGCDINATNKSQENSLNLALKHNQFDVLHPGF